MTVHDVPAAARGLRNLVIEPGMSESDAGASMQFLATFNECTLGIVRFSGRTPWERHRGGDELLHVLEGENEVTVLADGGPAHVTAEKARRLLGFAPRPATTTIVDCAESLLVAHC